MPSNARDGMSTSDRISAWQVYREAFRETCASLAGTCSGLSSSSMSDPLGLGLKLITTT